MLKRQLKHLRSLAVALLAYVLSGIINFRQIFSAFFRRHLTSWWQILLLVVFAVIFFYYPVGGLMVHDIDTSNSYRPQTENGQLASIDMASHLINREVYYKIWTPNLPFLFPSYFLDNMPNFQLGLMSGVSKTVQALNNLPLPAASDTAAAELSEAAELLQYPGNVWMFSPQNHLIPAPSSGTQYKKGRKKLNNFNREVAAGRVVFLKSPQNFSFILNQIRKDINHMVIKTENHVRETHDSFMDFKADDIFYFNLGKLYAYSQILKAFGYDFKNILISCDVYQQWTTLLKTLEEAKDINPTVVRNGRLNSSFAPNHLMTLNYFASRAVNHLSRIIDKLQSANG